MFYDDAQTCAADTYGVIRIKTQTTGFPNKFSCSFIFLFQFIQCKAQIAHQRDENNHAKVKPLRFFYFTPSIICLCYIVDYFSYLVLEKSWQRTPEWTFDFLMCQHLAAIMASRLEYVLQKYPQMGSIPFVITTRKNIFYSDTY